LTAALSSDRMQIVVSDSGAGNIKYAGKQTGRRVKHLACPGPIIPNLGPVNLLAAPKQRFEWFKSYAPDTLQLIQFDISDSDLIKNWQNFWTLIRDWQGEMTFWMSHRDAADKCMLMSLLNELSDLEQLQVIDVSKAPLKKAPIVTLGECSPDMILQAEEHLRPVQSAELEWAKQNLARFSKPDSGRHFFDETALTSNTVQSADEVILGFLGAEWQKLSSCIDDIFADQMDKKLYDLDYFLILSRLHFLDRTGKIERRGHSEKPLFDDSPLMGEVRITPKRKGSL